MPLRQFQHLYCHFGENILDKGGRILKYQHIVLKIEFGTSFASLLLHDQTKEFLLI